MAEEPWWVLPRAFPLYHWSPTERRKSIMWRGLTPGQWSTDRLWKPPVVCFASNPDLAWSLSGKTARGRQIHSWDLWMLWSDDVPGGYEEIVDYYKDSDRSYVKEYRVYERIFKRHLWYVGTRTQEGQRG
jgi:hypothetical protein